MNRFIRNNPSEPIQQLTAPLRLRRKIASSSILGRNCYKKLILKTAKKYVVAI